MTWEQLVWLSNIRIGASLFVILFSLALFSDILSGLIEHFRHGLLPRWQDTWDVAAMALFAGLAYRHFALLVLLVTDQSYADGPWVRYALRLTPPTILLALVLGFACVVRYNRHNPDFFLVRWWQAILERRRPPEDVLNWKHDE